MPLLSACVLTRDDAALLPACLGSLEDVVDEIVVLDCGSTDDTVSEAERLGARVVQVRWPDDEGVARNTGAAACTGDYVLFLDPAERLVPGAAAALREAMDANVPAALLPRVEADRVEPDLAAVVAGEGRLSEPGLTPRLLRRDKADRWSGVALARPMIALAGAPELDAWIVSVDLVAQGRGDDRDEVWIRRTVLAPEDARVLAAAARHLRGRGRLDLAHTLADRAWTAAMSGPTREGLVPACTVRALLQLDGGDARGALATVRQARACGAGHPNVDLLEALAGIERNTPSSLEAAEGALRRALSREGVKLIEAPLPGATGDAARIALATVMLATGRYEAAASAIDACRGAAARALPARLARAEAALHVDGPEAALGQLVKLLEHGRADGWTLAAAAALALGRRGDALAFIDRAEERADGGFIAPHRADLARRTRAVLTATAVRPRLTGDPPARDEVEAPLVEAERAVGLGDLDQGLHLVAEALRRDPADVEAWTDLGVIFHLAGTADAAALALRTASELDPRSSSLPLQLAVVLFGAGRLADACAQARRALSMDESQDARLLLQAMDVEGAPRPAVAVAVESASASAMMAVIRQARCRPLNAWDDLVQAIGPRPWLATTGASMLIADASTAPALIDAARAGGLVIAWLGTSPPVEVDRVLLPDETLLQAVMTATADLPARRRIDAPLLSVVVPTRNRAASVVTLLDRLALQDVPPSLIEVVLVDDGSETPVTRARLGARPWSVTLVHQTHQGPAAARNAGVDRARGRFVWFLDDDARPSVDAARRHLVGQLSEPAALVGAFRLLERHRRTVWDHLLDTTPLHLGRPDVPVGDALSWRSFAVSNTSVPLHALRAIEGFDATAFPDPAYEDAELGLRLTEAGTALIHRPDIRCGHDHRTSIDAWLVRARQAGRAQVALRDRHPGREDVLRLDDRRDTVLDALRSVVQLGAPRVSEALQNLRRLAAARLPSDPQERMAACGRVRALAEVVGDAMHQQGLLDGLSIDGPARDPRLQPTSIVIAHEAEAPDADATLARILGDVRRTTEGPVEVIVACIGEGGATLHGDPDLRPVFLAPGSSRIEAWNRGIAVTSGDTLFLCDDGILFTPGWRPALLAHMVVRPEIGLVAALGARSRSDLDGAAAAFARERIGHHAWPLEVPLDRVMIRRAVVDVLGGIDPDMGALAGTDLALRARAAGFRVRLAGDVLVGGIERNLIVEASARGAFVRRWRTLPDDREGLLRSLLWCDPPARICGPELPAGPTRLLGRVAPVSPPAQGSQEAAPVLARTG